MTKKRVTGLKKLIAGVAATCALLVAVPEPAQAQEILLTGPLAGAPPVRNLRLYRKQRLEFAPAVSFTLLDEYLQQILMGARINYNFTDWLAFGAWGAFSPEFVHIERDLVDKIQVVNAARINTPNSEDDINRRLTAHNMGPVLGEQLGSIDFVAAPQLTLVPFRGKIAIFQSIYVDSDLYFFGGAAIAGVTERADCARGACTVNPQGTVPFEMESRVAIAPTFGLGFTFYTGRWSALGFEYRMMPFARNTGGFDNRGGGPDKRFPDLAIDENDRELKLNQMLTVSFNIYLPLDYQVSE